MGKLGKKIKVAESRMVQHQEEYLENVLNNAEHTEAEQGGVVQQTLSPDPLPLKGEGVNTNSGAPAMPAGNNIAQPLPSPLSFGEGWGGAPTKGISVKLPYSLYDALDAIKKQTQRTGNPRDKMGIGDLVVLAVKEFVERNRVG